jgi:hypothetical protein
MSADQCFITHALLISGIDIHCDTIRSDRGAD